MKDEKEIRRYKESYRKAKEKFWKLAQKTKSPIWAKIKFTRSAIIEYWKEWLLAWVLGDKEERIFNKNKLNKELWQEAIDKRYWETDEKWLWDNFEKMVKSKEEQKRNELIKRYFPESLLNK
jgi:hypothetical protein